MTQCDETGAKLQQTMTAFAFRSARESPLLPFDADFDTGIEPDRNVEIEQQRVERFDASFVRVCRR